MRCGGDALWHWPLWLGTRFRRQPRAPRRASCGLRGIDGSARPSKWLSCRLRVANAKKQAWLPGICQRTSLGRRFSPSRTRVRTSCFVFEAFVSFVILARHCRCSLRKGSIKIGAGGWRRTDTAIVRRGISVPLPVFWLPGRARPCFPGSSNTGMAHTGPEGDPSDLNIPSPSYNGCTTEGPPVNGGAGL
jgi:hypothetical protein